MEQKSTIQKELESISPELAQLLPEKKNNIPSDQAYFDALPEQLLHQIRRETQPPLRRLYHPIGKLAVAAMLTGVMLTGMYIFSPSTSDQAETINLSHELAQIPNEELTQFLGEQTADHLPTSYIKEIQEISTQELETYYQETFF